MARWVATLRADTDFPLASAASFKDISLRLSSLMGWRWSGGSCSIAACKGDLIF